MTTNQSLAIIAALILAAAVGPALGDTPSATAATPQPTLSVETLQPETRELPLTLTANGSIAAWQEAIIGAEVGGLRLAEVRAQVGDRVRKGQILAVFDAEPVMADVAQSQAALAEAEANLAEARLNAERVRRMRGSSALSTAMSAQQADQYLAQEQASAARLKSAQAQLDIRQLRLRHTRVLASDDGVVSARAATLGAVPDAGQELFRLIRQNRLEWRGEVTAAELLQLKPGLAVGVEAPGAARVAGKLRTVAPTLDAQSRNGLVYVDLPQAEQAGLRPGMFAKGSFQLGTRPALTVPQEALALREGFSYVFRLDGPREAHGGTARVVQVKVQLGRHDGPRVEILSGLNPDDRLVASGAAFLADGDNVRVVAK